MLYVLLTVPFILGACGAETTGTASAPAPDAPAAETVAVTESTAPATKPVTEVDVAAAPTEPAPAASEEVEVAAVEPTAPTEPVPADPRMKAAAFMAAVTSCEVSTGTVPMSFIGDETGGSMVVGAGRITVPYRMKLDGDGELVFQRDYQGWGTRPFEVRKDSVWLRGDSSDFDCPVPQEVAARFNAET